MEYSVESNMTAKNICTSDNATCIEILGFIYWGLPVFFSTFGCIMNIIAFIGLVSIKCKKPRTLLLLSLVSSNFIMSSMILTNVIYVIFVTDNDINCATLVTITGHFVNEKTALLAPLASVVYRGIIFIEYFTILAMTVDMLVAVWKPLKHKIIVTKYRICVYLLCIWLFAIASTVPLAALTVTLSSESFREMSHKLTTVAASFIISSFTILSLLYAFIFHRIRRHIGQRLSAKKRRKVRKKAVTTILILVLFAACFFPTCINAYIAQGAVWSDAAIKNNASLIYWSITTGCLLLTDTIFEPVIAIAREHSIRESLQDVVQKCRLYCNKKPTSKRNNCAIPSGQNRERTEMHVLRTNIRTD